MTMKYILFFTVLWAGGLVSNRLAAQNEWSLEQCIRYAWDNNISLRQQKLTGEQSKNTLTQSKLDFLPSVSANLSYQMRWGLAETLVEMEGSGGYVTAYRDNASQQLNPGISASVSLFEGMQKVNALRRNRADYEASQQDVEQLRNQISLEIARAYLQVLLSQEVLAAAGKSRESVEQQRAVTEKLVAAGSQPYSNLLEMDAQLATEEVQFVTASNNVEIAYLTLRQLLDMAPDAEFTIASPEIDVELTHRIEATKGIYDMARGLPQIKAAEWRKESAAYNLAIARGRYWPSVSFSFSYGAWASYSNLTPSENLLLQLSRNASPAIGLNLNIPIFQRWSIVTGAKNAHLSLRIAELELENKQNALYKEIQQAVADASAAYNRYRAGERNVAAMQESFRYTQQRLEAGAVHGTDYTVAKNNLFKAQSDMLQAKYQYVFQIKIIDFYKGIALEL
jgi:outer membrane protein